MPICHTETKFVSFWNFIIPFIRLWGILTAIVLCGTGIDVLVHYNFKGIYIIMASVIVLFLEISWIFSHIRRLCVKNKRATSIWHMPSTKHWQKSVFYFPLSIVIVFKSYRLWLSSIASAVLIILACLHVLVSIRNHKRTVGKRTLLLDDEDYQDRHEEVIFEILDNSIRSKDEVSVEEPGGHTLDI